MLLPTFLERLQHGWNAFKNPREPTQRYSYGAYSYDAGRRRLSFSAEKSISASVNTRIANDIAQVNIIHARVDDNGNYVETIKSGLQNIFSVEANIDQSARDFMFDLVSTMLDEGVVACVPIDTNVDPRTNNVFNILTMRTAKIIKWYPKSVTVKVYNDNTGTKEELTIPKSMTAIIYNPFYSVMNEPNSTLQRLIRKLNILDAIDEQSGSGKLDVLFSVPYSLNTPGKEEWAKKRKKNIEEQLKDSKYGIAYIDQTEHVTQLNRPVENNLMKQIEFLSDTFYSQLGITLEIFKGTADEKTMLNYYNSTLEPILTAICQEFRRKYISKTARSQNQSIIFIRDPFKLLPLKDLAEVANTFINCEIATSNEMRSKVGYKPSDDPRADQLLNKNINKADPGFEQMEEETTAEQEQTEEENQNGT